ncbi:hypothetical protein VTO73DRAFT_3449 [Trametes versicolor]
MHCYKPDLKRSCCPQYTIRFDTLEFKPSKSHRKLLSRWNRFVVHGDVPYGVDFIDGSSQEPPAAAVAMSKDKGETTHVFKLAEDIHASESGFLKDGDAPAHQFQVTLEPASYTEEKFALYSRYQKEIHHEIWDREPSGFKEFLVQNPLVPQAIDYPSGRPDHLPVEYGAYHQLYRLDGKLIAMSVINILPTCVLSVYFMWEKKWEKFSLGKLSVLREAALAIEMHEAGVVAMRYIYMGYYVHSCRKMLYKGDYSPSYLLDPEDYTWASLDTCRPLLDKYHYACFTHPERSLDTPATSPDPTPEIPLEVLQNVQHVVQTERGQVVAPIVDSVEWRRQRTRDTLLGTLDAFGEKLTQEVLFDLTSL